MTSRASRPGGEPSGALSVGVVVGAHGTRGGLRVRPWDPASTSLRVGIVVSVTVPGAAAGAVPGARPVAYRVAEVARGSRDELLVQLEGVGDRDLALALRGAELLVSREVLDPLASGEFYLADVIGCEVHGTVGGATAKHLGRVVGVGSNGPQDLLEVSEPGGTGRTWLMPAMPPFLVDFDGVRLVVDLPQGFGPEDVEEPGGA